MKYIDFCGNYVSQLGLGTATFITKNDLISSLQYAITHGINYIDTAYIYNDGLGEVYIGEWNRYIRRDKYFIATKRNISENIWRPEAICSTVLSQCNRLNIKYIDYFLLHGLDGYTAVDDWKRKKLLITKCLNILKLSGLVKHVGFSFFGKGKDLEYILNTYDWDFVQIRHNLIDDHNFKTIYDSDYLTIDAAKKYKEQHEDFGIMIMEPMSSSMLYGLDYGENIPSEYIGLKYNIDTGYPMLIGATKKFQLEQTIYLYNRIISNEDNIEMEYFIDKINSFLDAKLDNEKCINCYKCANCNKYNMWSIVRMLNEKKVKKESNKLDDYIYRCGIPDCGKCTKCIENCPTVNIPTVLSEIRSMYAYGERVTKN